MKRLNSFLLPVLFLTLLLSSGCGDKKEKIKARLSTITSSVYSSVTIQPDSLYEVFSVVPGIIDSSYVEEGASVQFNQPLVHIVNDKSELMKQNAALSLELARENLGGKSAVLNDLEKELETARMKMRNDSANYFRQKNLWDQGIGSRIEFESRQLAYEQSRNNLDILQKRYSRTKKELQTSLQQAENNYQSNIFSVRDYMIRSEINGKVYSLLKEKGELVNVQQPIATVGKSDKFVIEMLVDEVDIVRIKKGQLALITLDAYENEVFKAKVTIIYPSKNERTQTFRVEAEFMNAPPTLYPGLSGEANIVIETRENAIVIPIEYLVNDHTVETEDGPAEVTTGLRNMSMVEITSGLDTNTYLLKPTP